jgi:hypothetical protein
MQTIQFFNSSSAGSSLSASLPVVFQKFVTIAGSAATPGTGNVPSDLLPAIAAGSCAAYGGQIVNNGCYDLKADITYVVGGDCSNPGCAATASAYSKSVVSIYIPKNSVFPIPDGFYQQVQISSVDSAHAAIANTSDVVAQLHSSYSPSCGGCVPAIA